MTSPGLPYHPHVIVETLDGRSYCIPCDPAGIPMTLPQDAWKVSSVGTGEPEQIIPDEGVLTHLGKPVMIDRHLTGSVLIGFKYTISIFPQMARPDETPDYWLASETAADTLRRARSLPWRMFRNDDPRETRSL